MYWRDVITLEAVQHGTDAEGYPTETVEATQVFADVQSTKRSEFYKAKQIGIDLAITVKLRAAVAAVGTACGDVFLPVEGDAAVTAVPRLYRDSRLINKSYCHSGSSLVLFPSLKLGNNIFNASRFACRCKQRQAQNMATITSDLSVRK